jgi:hypothetical protein
MTAETKFKIETLQRSKIIMAIEAVAVNTSVMIGMYLVEKYFVESLAKNVLLIVAGVFGIVYALFASFGNVKKHMEIKKLENT